jgi:predicted TIM-barrel fold metal-dependent hydrolase
VLQRKEDGKYQNERHYSNSFVNPVTIKADNGNNVYKSTEEVIKTILELLEYINSLTIIDTHEHLAPWEKFRNRGDFFGEYLMHYFSVDLLNAGLSAEDLDKLRGGELDIREKWKIAEPYWELCRYTGYGQNLDRSVRGIYGIERIDGNTVEKLNEKYRGLFDSGGHYQKVLKELSGIKIGLLDSCRTIDFDSKYFISVNRFDSLVYPGSGADLVHLEKLGAIAINSFDDYLDACEAWILDFVCKTNSRILKCGLAYIRSLAFGRAEKSEAEKSFNGFFGSDWAFDKMELILKPSPAFQNYVMRRILNIAQKEHMVLQVHTGIQEGTGNLLANTDPLLLNNLFLEFPQLKFDVFHIGYPYQRELGALCKMFPNVSIDMCWAHILSPEACVDALSEWIELFPYSKICGFGGDYCFVDGVFGHQQAARETIAEVLSRKIEKRLFGLDEACKIAKAILHDNPARIFGIIS